MSDYEPKTPTTLWRDIPPTFRSVASPPTRIGEPRCECVTRLWNSGKGKVGEYQQCARRATATGRCWEHERVVAAVGLRTWRKEAVAMGFMDREGIATEFTPYVMRHEQSGCLTVYFSGEPDYSEQLTDQIMLYRSLETNEIVGCRIDDVGTENPT